MLSHRATHDPPRGVLGRADKMLLGVVGTGQAPTDAKRPVGVISLIKPDRRLRGDSIPSKLLNCSEETRRGKVKEN